MTNLEQETNQIKKIATESLAKILEHGDSCQIFVTKHTSSMTYAFECGGGNFYARLGQVKEWLIVQDQTQRNEINNQTKL